MNKACATANHDALTKVYSDEKQRQRSGYLIGGVAIIALASVAIVLGAGLSATGIGAVVGVPFIALGALAIHNFRTDNKESEKKFLEKSKDVFAELDTNITQVLEAKTQSTNVSQSHQITTPTNTPNLNNSPSNNIMNQQK
jgi:hypothetical protein